MRCCDEVSVDNFWDISTGEEVTYGSERVGKDGKNAYFTGT